MEEIHEYEIDGLIQTLKETGIKGIMKYTDVLVLNHMMERGWIPGIDERDKLIKVLKEQSDMSYGDIATLLTRYNDWKQYLPSYSLGLQMKLESVNQLYNSIVPFRWIGSGGNRKLIGIVKEVKGFTIYDQTGKHPMKVGDVNESYSISWNNYIKLTTPQQKYIIDEVKNLKQRIM